MVPAVSKVPGLSVVLTALTRFTVVPGDSVELSKLEVKSVAELLSVLVKVVASVVKSRLFVVEIKSEDSPELGFCVDDWEVDSKDKVGKLGRAFVVLEDLVEDDSDVKGSKVFVDVDSVIELVDESDDLEISGSLEELLDSIAELVGSMVGLEVTDSTDALVVGSSDEVVDSAVTSIFGVSLNEVEINFAVVVAT